MLKSQFMFCTAIAASLLMGGCSQIFLQIRGKDYRIYVTNEASGDMTVIDLFHPGGGGYSSAGQAAARDSRQP